MDPRSSERTRRFVAEHEAPGRHTPSGLPIDVVYGDDHLHDRLGFPGQYPFVRGVHPTMYRGRLWTMRQYAGFGTASETNRRFRDLLAAGQTGLSVAFDLPTQMGYDPDDPLARAEVGKVGVSIASLDDMLALFDGIPLGDVSTSMTINTTAIVLLALYEAVARAQGVPSQRVSGTLQNDILKEYAARGTYRYPPTPSLRLITDIFAYTARHLPRWNPISISGYHMREAGCTAVQEVAFTLANGVAYVDAALQTGLDVDAFAARLSFFFNGHNHLFEEVAKFRAARRLWARLMKERFAAKDPKSWLLRFHTQTAGSTLTSQQPDNNVVRVAIQALAAVLGGTQSLHTNSRDEALGLPTDAAARLALRTQQILGFESGVGDTVDPLGGAPFIEDLTDRIESEAQALMSEIEGLGGAAAAIEAGFYQRCIHRAAYEHQLRVERGETVIVGVNRFTEVEEDGLPFRVDPTVAERRREAVAKVRSDRAAGPANDALASLVSAARGRENLVPRVLACVEAHVTIGEIGAAFESVFGRYREVPVF